MRQTTFTELDGGLYNPSGGARSTAEDYMKFMVMLMNKGKYNGKQILSEESVDEMMKIQTANVPKRYIPKAAEGFNYALGSWVVEEGPLPSSPNGGKGGNRSCQPGFIWHMANDRFLPWLCLYTFCKKLFG